jgi:IS30 family transposase
MVKFTIFAPPSKKSQKMAHLTQEQRYKIQTLSQLNYSQKFIAEVIEKDKSVVSRELQRNSDKRNGVYKAELAIKKCEARHKSKKKKIHFTDQVKEFVDENLKNDFSPEQILGVARKNNISCVSIERIYQYVWDDKSKGGLLHLHLRTQGKKYRKRGAAKDKRGQIVGRVGIENRPAIVEEKNRFGDFEVDLIIGKDHKSAILTANDRATGLLRMKKIESKGAIEVKNAIVTVLKQWSNKLYTVTSDNGKEFSGHQKVAEELGVDYFFARPYHSWERGANENLNGLVRQYFPKGSDFKSITDEQVKQVEEKLNNRPRKRFGFETPNYLYLQLINNPNGKVAFMT